MVSLIHSLCCGLHLRFARVYPELNMKVRTIMLATIMLHICGGLDRSPMSNIDFRNAYVI